MRIWETMRVWECGANNTHPPACMHDEMWRLPLTGMLQRQLRCCIGLQP